MQKPLLLQLKSKIQSMNVNDLNALLADKKAIEKLYLE